ncbi:MULTISPECIES: hypothetical protein [Bacillus]|nr:MULTISPECIES: hypothetical protein [Bacillus]
MASFFSSATQAFSLDIEVTQKQTISCPFGQLIYIIFECGGSIFQIYPIK